MVYSPFDQVNKNVGKHGPFVNAHLSVYYYAASAEALIRLQTDILVADTCSSLSPPIDGCLTRGCGCSEQLVLVSLEAGGLALGYTLYSNIILSSFTRQTLLQRYTSNQQTSNREVKKM